MSRLQNSIKNMLSANTRLADASNGTKIAVVPRRFYVHKQKTLNGASSKDIANVVSLERSLCAGDSVVVWSQIKSGEAVYLHLYIIKNSWLSTQAKDAWFLVPACWLLSQSMQEPSVLCIDNMFVAKTHKGSVCVFTSPVMSRPELFAEANGVDPGNIVKSDDNLEQLVESSIKKIAAIELRHFFNPALIERVKRYDFRPAFVSAVGILLLYLSLSSAYFYWSASTTDARIAELRPQVSDTLVAANSAQSALASIADYQTLFNARNFTLPIWMSLQSVYEQGGRFIYIRYLLDGSFNIGIEAKSASQAVKSVSEAPWVQSASLAGDVQSLDNTERFEIVVRLRKMPK